MIKASGEQNNKEPKSKKAKYMTMQH